MLLKVMLKILVNFRGVIRKKKYTGTLTPNTLTITNVAVTTALIYTNSKPENFKVYITGIKDNQQVIFGDDTSTYRALIVEKDGVYDVNWEDNHYAYCLWCNFLGDCNITITQLPTSILKDLSGNGNHAYLYGGKGKLNSGVGIYAVDFTSYSKTSVVADVSHNTVKVDKFLKMIQEEDGTVDIEPLLGKMTDNLIVAATKEYPDLFGGVTIGNGKIKIGVPGIDKDIVLEAADIDHFKSCLK